MAASSKRNEGPPTAPLRQRCDLWTVGPRGTILCSTDDGQTWSQQASGTGFALYTLHGTGSHLYAVGARSTVFTAVTGVSIGNREQAERGPNCFPFTAAARTRGSSATTEPSYTRPIGAKLAATDQWRERLLRVIYGDGEHLWTAGFGGTILHSSDGGEHWERQNSGVNKTLTSFYGSGKDLWAAGVAGTVLHTADRGEHWELQSTETWRNLEEVRGNGAHLWVVGYGGTVMQSTDGGQTWRRQDVR